MTSNEPPKEFGKNLDIDLKGVKECYPQFESKAWRTKYYLVERYKMFSYLSVSNGFLNVCCRNPNCEKTTNLHIHHINGNGHTELDGWKLHKETKKQIYEESEDLMLLCEECHHGYHDALLDREEIKDIRDIEEEIKEMKQ